MSTRTVTIAGKAGSINSHFGNASGSGSRPARGNRPNNRGNGRGNGRPNQNKGPESKISKFSKPGRGGKQGQRGRGGRGGRGGQRGGGRGGAPQKKKSAEELDAELNAYMMKDEKTALARLDAELDDYKNSRDQAASSTDAPASEAQ